MRKFLGAFVLGSILCTPVHASNEVYFNRVTDAIFLAEGGPKAKKPFGILSVPCSSYSDCRKVCLNTVRNNYRRWEKAGKPGEYLSFLQSRYAPINSNTDNGTNRYWLKNVRFFMGAK